MQARTPDKQFAPKQVSQNVSPSLQVVALALALCKGEDAKADPDIVLQQLTVLQQVGCMGCMRGGGTPCIGPLAFSNHREQESVPPAC